MSKLPPYIKRRKGTKNLYAYFTYPPHVRDMFDGKKFREISLGTSDPREAEIIALPHIREHKQTLYMYNLVKRIAPYKKVGGGDEEEYMRAAVVELLRNGVRKDFLHMPGMKDNNDGTRTFATETEVFTIGADGKVAETKPNDWTVKVPVSVLTKDEAESAVATERRAVRLGVKEPGDTDWDVIESYIEAEGKSEAWRREAEQVYSDWQSLVGKRFTDADTPDGRKLWNSYIEKGLKSKTADKKLNFLSAPINAEMRRKNKRVSFNPFSRAGRELGDALRKRPFMDRELAIIDANLHRLGPNERLLYLFARHTGCRRSEAWQVEETREKGLRVIWFGSKNKQSVRRIPLPDALVPFVPPVIDGPLFTDSPINVGKNFNRAIRRFGITNEAITLHSFRHRAKDRLRAEGCREELSLEIFGHERITVARSYGLGYPMTVLKPWVEKMGQYDAETL
ncbi:hypothetical protein [Salinarimonas ramus]|uniref:hypothetical protein n=1 Tax=Salinarimonas ramus TaxID=690164 RepID=UPI0016661813|nr:hypothetical protein [Salinarimonas ramus]